VSDGAIVAIVGLLVLAVTAIGATAFRWFWRLLPPPPARDEVMRRSAVRHDAEQTSRGWR